MIPDYESPAFSFYDEAFLISRIQSDSNMPPPRNAQPMIVATLAREVELKQQREDPFGARDWDLEAERRWRSWDASIFAGALDKLFGRPS